MSNGGMVGNQNGKKHGMHGAKVYKAWAAMKSRCTNPNVPGYKRYGGRGIGYDPDWEGFPNFYRDMGDPTTPLHTLERIDNNAGYSKANCRWATKKEQACNTRQTVLVEINGETKCFHDWCKEYNITPGIVYYRMKKGVDIKRALSEPYDSSWYVIVRGAPVNENPDKARGVWYNPQKRKYRAQISLKGGGKKHLGWFATCDEAHQAYLNEKGRA
jgi:hypothetical protein